MREVKLGFTSDYLTKDDKPWLPIMGEFHYSRYPKEFWEEELWKMKAGGIQIVSTYAIWVHHEEREGSYDFSGNKDLRSFLKLCDKCSLYVLLRIGPWDNEEILNGGIPDWLMESMDSKEEYYNKVNQFYEVIIEQVKGLENKEGGPLLSIQISPTPVYYCDAPWDERVTKLPPSSNYIFTEKKHDWTTEYEEKTGKEAVLGKNRLPFFTAELGGGLQVTKHRRPLVHAKDIGAMSMVKLGSGANVLGFYMYHGGTNPMRKLSPVEGSCKKACELHFPELSYDFQAPIREFGQIGTSYREIKLLGMFLQEFGDELCKMKAEIPTDSPQNPADLEDLRYSIRREGDRGYIFINNYQRNYRMKRHDELSVKIMLDNQKCIEFPKFSLQNEELFFLPFNMQLNHAKLRTALATPLCRLHNKITSTIFYGDREPEFELEGELGEEELILISRKEACNAYKVILDQEYLIISEALIVQEKEGVLIFSEESPLLQVYPPFSKIPKGYKVVGRSEEFTLYKRQLEKRNGSVATSLLSQSDQKNVYEISVSVEPHEMETYLKLSYEGESARIFMGDTLLADNFFVDGIFEIGLKRFGYPSVLRLEIYPLKQGDPIYLEKFPASQKKVVQELISATVYADYKSELSF